MRMIEAFVSVLGFAGVAVVGPASACGVSVACECPGTAQKSKVLERSVNQALGEGMQ
jgi:hypothetical protein